MKSFPLKIVTLDGEFFNGQVVQVSLRSIDGDVSILAGHIPYITAIGMGECRIYFEQASEPRRAACMGGILSVSNDCVRIAATTFEWAEDIDRERAFAAKKRAEEEILRKKDKINTSIAEAKLKRALTRISVADKIK